MDGWISKPASYTGRVRGRRTRPRAHADPHTSRCRAATHEILRVERKLTQDSPQLACDESTTALSTDSAVWT